MAEGNKPLSLIKNLFFIKENQLIVVGDTFTAFQSKYVGVDAQPFIEQALRKPMVILKFPELANEVLPDLVL
ncbi:hypothetical protein MACH07_21970 [Flagellimonas marinaquae]|uniref:Uncharacterized protein n=1 Tax=Flagellimonas marinaquae TaxID=254955 RepID=A0AA48KPM2_9FLAO|nr:hypothetical protein MACH07_21970 [Allomuricauda aquimarina]